MTTSRDARPLTGHSSSRRDGGVICACVGSLSTFTLPDWESTIGNYWANAGTRTFA
jgi:hypothetical protein